LSDTEDAGKIDRVLFGGDANLDADHKLLMFSATFSEKARQVAAEYMGPDHPVIYVGRFGSSHGNIQHEIIEVEHFNKRQKLYEILSQADNMRRTIIFCNAKPECDRLDDFLFNKGLPVLCTHSGRAQIEREIAM
jgi:ATP-dependent RNA helicase DDX3X